MNATRDTLSKLDAKQQHGGEIRVRGRVVVHRSDVRCDSSRPDSRVASLGIAVATPMLGVEPLRVE